jgi:hypothetical protein
VHSFIIPVNEVKQKQKAVASCRLQAAGFQTCNLQPATAFLQQSMAFLFGVP